MRLFRVLLRLTALLALLQLVALALLGQAGCVPLAAPETPVPCLRITDDTIDLLDRTVVDIAVEVRAAADLWRMPLDVQGSDGLCPRRLRTDEMAGESAKTCSGGCDIRIERRLSWVLTDSSCEHSYYLRTSVAHELGHWLESDFGGAGHSPDERDLMYYGRFPCELKEPTRRDRKAVQ